jgi:FKBP-type peptidyl-prolyl cis-trans isomerase FklB
MKLNTTMALALGLCGFALAAEDQPALTSDLDKASYAIGSNIGKRFKTQGLELNNAAFALGFKEAITGAKATLSDEDAKVALAAFEKTMTEKQEADMKEQVTKNQKEGEAFLADNAEKEGVKTTASGLQYKVVKAGEGKKPKSSDTVKVHYRGTLLNGTEFDSSYARNEPITFPLDQVIPGWTEGVQLMPVGSKYTLYIPGKLAYGERGSPPTIGPNATLVFEVELLGIEDGKDK